MDAARPGGAGVVLFAQTQRGEVGCGPSRRFAWIEKTPGRLVQRFRGFAGRVYSIV